MNVLELFAGIGGIGLGLERAGMTVVGQVEIDPYCQRVLAKHWPEVSRHDDVRTCITWWQSKPRPPVDLIAGGFPCQDISSAGQRAGIANGTRSSLWGHMAATIRALRPRYILVENVAALLVRGLDTLLTDLAESGYDAQWDCLPASAFGAPHRRDRVFIVAYPNSVGCLSGRGPQEAPEPTGRPGSGVRSANVADVERRADLGGLTPPVFRHIPRRMKKRAVTGPLNPTWVEWLTGFPPGWTDLGPSATPSSRS